MNGTPSIAGFFKVVTCSCGDVTNDCMIFRCRLATYIVDVAGAMRLVHAYHWLNNGSTSTFGFKYTLRAVIFFTLTIVPQKRQNLLCDGLVVMAAFAFESLVHIGESHQQVIGLRQLDKGCVPGLFTVDDLRD